MNDRQLTIIVEKYRPYLIAKGSELLLSPQKAIEMVDDLVACGEMIVGCDGWRYVGDARCGIVEDLGVELSIEETIPWEEMTPEINASVVRAFLGRLPQQIDLVSLQLNDPEVQNALVEAIDGYGPRG